MRSAIITAILSLLMCTAGIAQSIVEAEGFFDTDPGVGNGIALGNALNGSTAVISGNLPLGITSGFHSFYVRCKSNAGLWSGARGRTVFVTANANQLPEVQEVVACEYFVDVDPGVGNGFDVPVSPAPTDAAVLYQYASSQSIGVHQMGVRFKASSGYWSNTRMRTFLVRQANDMQVAEVIDAGEYFFDSDPGAGHGIPLSIISPGVSVSVDASIAESLSPGVHQMYVRYRTDMGYWSAARPRTVIVTAGALGNVVYQIDAAEYFFDTDPGAGHGNPIEVSTAGALVPLTASIVLNLAPGMHQLYVRYRSDIGYWGNARARSVLVTDGPLGITAHYIDAAEYYIDSDPGLGNGTPIAVPTATIVDISELIDMTGVSVGAHQLFIRVRSDQNVWSDYAMQPFTITSDTQPVFSLQALNPLCAGSNTGTIEVTAVGGTPPFFYAWDGVVGNDTLFNAPAGSHHLVVTDAASAIVLDTTLTLVDPAELIYQLNSADVSCFGGNDGAASVLASGGTGNYLYDWNGFNPSQLIAGVYFFNVTDGNGCDVSGSVTITQPDVVSVSTAITPASASGVCDGAIDLTIEGGIAPYIVLWNDPGASTGDPIVGLCEGTYTANITDANGCTVSSEPSIIALGLEEITDGNPEVRISPNPGFGVFSVNLSAEAPGELTWSVVDSRGRVVMQAAAVQNVGSKEQFAIDLTNMSQGLYHLQIGFNGAMSSHRLMVLSFR